MNIQLKYKEISFSPNLQASTTSLLFQKDHELYRKIRPPAGQSYENSLWSLGNHLLDYCQLVLCKTGQQDLIKASPAFQGALRIINYYLYYEISAIWRKIFLCLPTPIGNVKLMLWLTFMRSFGNKNHRQFQLWAKSSTEGTVNSINLNRGEKYRELDEIWQNDELV